jgi:hypothetical protein
MVLNCSLLMEKIDDVILNCTEGWLENLQAWMLACFQMIIWSRKSFNICDKKEKYAEGLLFGNGRNMWQWQSNFKKVQSGGKSAGRVTYPISDFDSILMSVWACKISSYVTKPQVQILLDRRRSDSAVIRHYALDGFSTTTQCNCSLRMKLSDCGEVVDDLGWRLKLYSAALC